VNYYDAGRMDSTDTEGHGQALDMRDSGAEKYESELSHFRLADAAVSSHGMRATTPDSNGQTPQRYTQLGNYAGLSGPSTHSRHQDDQGSIKGSLISSLSSHSLEVPGNRAEAYTQEAEPRASVSSDHASEDESSLEHHGEEIAAVQVAPQYTEEDKGRMRLVFNQIFSSIMPNSTPHIGLGNGSDHGGSIGRENIYYREKVKVTTSLPAKETKFRDKTRLVQTMKFHQGAIWAMKFSPCGAYLCTAGQDMHVVIWCVGPLPADAHEAGKDGAGGLAAKTEATETKSGAVDPKAQRRSFNFSDSRKGTSYAADSGGDLKPFINSVPYRVLEGHTGDVIDVAWSKSKFVLSASTDKTVCLWHVSRGECLQFFRHPDIVTAVEFHPAHDR
jgi:WD40 repeat protein